VEWLEFAPSLIAVLIAWLQLQQGSDRTKKKRTNDTACIEALSKKILALVISGLAILQKKICAFRIRSAHQNNPSPGNLLLVNGAEKKKHSISGFPLVAVQKRRSHLGRPNVVLKKKPSLSTNVDIEELSVFLRKAPQVANCYF
jgi:hypothetical protein